MGIGGSSISSSGGVDNINNINLIERTAGDLTTTSTSFIDATGMDISFTSGNNNLMISVLAMIRNSNADTETSLDIDVDGAREGGSSGLVTMAQAQTSGKVTGNFTHFTALQTAALHTYKLQWKVQGGTGTLFASGTTATRFNIIEVTSN